MIIWGSTGKEKTIASTQIYCPQCRNHAPASHVRVSRYFTLYFIPLFPTETLGEYVRCQQCQGQFNTNVLGLSREQIESALSPWSCARCGNNNPAEYVHCLSCNQPRS
jgi:hypothetical protein